MHAAIHSSTPSAGPQGQAAGIVWMLRWLLVLLLAFDQLSGPFHHHTHEGTADWHGHTQVQGDSDADEPYAEGVDHAPFAHAVIALRTQSSHEFKLPAGAEDAVLSLLAAATSLLLLAAPMAVTWRPDRRRRVIQSHRSLPPAGRAPPLQT